MKREIDKEKRKTNINRKENGLTTNSKKTHLEDTKRKKEKGKEKDTGKKKEKEKAK